MSRARKGSSPNPPVSSTDRRVDPRTSWVVAAAALSAATVVVASFFPAARLWGLNQLAFLPLAIRYCAFAVLALAFVPPLARVLYRLALVASAHHVNASRVVGGVVAVVVAIASVAAFHHFRVSTNLLGDGQLITQSFEAGQEGHDSVIMRSAHAIVTEETIAPGTTLLYYGAVKVGAKYKKEPAVAMRWLNCVLGGCFVVLLLWAARAKALGNEARIWLVVMGAFSCSTLLFFGYIENYTTPYLFDAIYAVLAFAALHRRCPVWVPFVPLAIACYAHVHSILMIPSYVYLVAWMRMRARRAQLMRYWIPLITVTGIVVIVACSTFEGMKKFFMPFGVTGNSLLAPRHFADIANEIAMLFPILPVVATLGWLGKRGDTVREKGATKDPASLLSHPVEWQFCATILIACAMYIFFFRPEIGMARDWDLFTMATIAIVPMSILALNRYARVFSIDANTSSRFAVPALAVVVVTGVAWVGVNTSTSSTIQRFQRILAYDKTHAAYAWENLAILEHDRGNLEASIRTMETAIANGNNPRHSVRLAVYLDEAGRTDEAIAVLRNVLERRPDFPKARYRLASFLEKKGDWAALLDVSREGVRYHPEESFYRFLYGESLIRAGRFDEGIAIFESCRDMDLPPSARARLEQVLSYYGKSQK